MSIVSCFRLPVSLVFSNVSISMKFKETRFHKTLFANVTLKGSFFSVSSFMLLKLTFFFESHFTNITYMSFFITLLKFNRLQFVKNRKIFEVFENGSEAFRLYQFVILKFVTFKYFNRLE